MAMAVVRPMLEGIDVSHWQGDIDWEQVAAAGKSFAYIKCTESTNYADPKFIENITAAKTYGLKVGGYHFYRPSESGEKQAEWFAQHLMGSGFNLPPVLDTEINPDDDNPTIIISETLNFLLNLEYLTEWRPCIYTSSSFWTRNMYLRKLRPIWCLYYSLWIANWKVSKPSVPRPWWRENWTFWQYTDSGTVPGIEGTVDLNKFNGDERKLKRILKKVKL